MNIVFAEIEDQDQLTIHGEIDGFEHNCTVGERIALGLTLDQAADLAEFGIREAYDRHMAEGA